MSETAKRPLNLWVEELHHGTLGLRYKVKRTLFAGESDFQHISIVETESFGRMLLNDSIVMLSERDEFVYHEMIAHVAMFVHPKVERVLVIGGGDGGTVREILRHRSVRHCRLVEIDPLVVEGCRAHLPWTAAALDDPRVQVTIADGVAFAARSRESYDLIIIDSTDPVGPATPLFGGEFYGNLKRMLNRDGVVISQAESPYYDLQRQQSMLEILGEGFSRVHLYNYVNITYPGGLWSFTYATDVDRCPLNAFESGRVNDSGMAFRYYGADVHRAAFALPAFQHTALEHLLTPIQR